MTNLRVRLEVTFRSICNSTPRRAMGAESIEVLFSDPLSRIHLQASSCGSLPSVSPAASANAIHLRRGTWQAARSFENVAHWRCHLSRIAKNAIPSK